MSIDTELLSTASFFSEKIMKIRKEISSSTPSLVSVTPVQLHKTNVAIMSKFNPVNHKTLEVVVHLNPLRPVTCCLESSDKHDSRFNHDCGKMTVLFLLDLSTAFNTVDHDRHVDRLEKYVDLSGTVLKWLKSYVKDRDYFESIDNSTSKQIKMTWRSPGVDPRASPV